MTTAMAALNLQNLTHTTGSCRPVQNRTEQDKGAHFRPVLQAPPSPGASSLPDPTHLAQLLIGQTANDPYGWRTIKTRRDRIGAGAILRK